MSVSLLTRNVARNKKGGGGGDTGSGGPGSGGGGGEGEPGDTLPDFVSLLALAAEHDAGTELSTAETDVEVEAGAFLGLAFAAHGPLIDADGDASAVTDPGGNAWVMLSAEQSVSSGHKFGVWLWGCRVVTPFTLGGADQITVAHSTASLRCLAVAEYEDVSSSFADQSNGGSGASATVDVADITPAVAMSLGLGAIAISVPTPVVDQPMMMPTSGAWVFVGSTAASGDPAGEGGPVTRKLILTMHHRFNGSAAAFGYDGTLIGIDELGPRAADWAAVHADAKGA